MFSTEIENNRRFTRRCNSESYSRQLFFLVGVSPVSRWCSWRILNPVTVIDYPKSITSATRNLDRRQNLKTYHCLSTFLWKAWLKKLKIYVVDMIPGPHLGVAQLYVNIEKGTTLNSVFYCQAFWQYFTLFIKWPSYTKSEYFWYLNKAKRKKERKKEIPFV